MQNDTGPATTLCWISGLVLALFAFPLSSATAPLATFGVWALALAVVSRSSPRGALSFPALYLLLLGLFHLGAVVSAALGATLDPRPPWIDSPYLVPALKLFTLAVGSFALGVMAASRGGRVDADPLLPPRPILYWGGLLVAGAAAALLWEGILRLGVLSAAYGDYWEQALSADVRMFGFGIMLFPIGILVAAFGATPKQLVIVGALYTTLLAPLFVAGFRGHPLVHGIALLAIWRRKNPPVARRVGIIAGVSLLVLAPAVKLARNWDQPLAQALRDASALDFVVEAGGSIRPLVETMNLIETGAEPLWLGRSYLIAAARVVPNLSSAPMAAGAGRDLNPNAWITMRTNPWLYERGGGIGFSGVAEPYLNFGWPGTAAAFFILGYALLHADRAASRTTFMAAIPCCLFGFVLWTVRNDSMGVFRATAIAVLLVLGLKAATRLGTRSVPQYRPPGSGLS
jgi:hypothetical protein